MTISLILPVHNGGSALEHCLKSVKALNPGPAEIIVVADGDADGSWRLAEELGMTVLRIPISGGPARARNLGAQEATGEILLFIDADVTIRPDTVRQVASFFQQHPDVAALFGSYDDEPFESNFLSQYKNLLHHYVHQTSNEEASTFWAGCGAIRRDIFFAMGGFDESFCRPSPNGCPGTIEDIELGYRLKKAGKRIRLLKDLQATHLKRWNMRSLVKADIFYRALPWTALILRDRQFVNDLNLKTTSRISVIAVYLLLLSLGSSVVIPWGLVPVCLLIVLLLGLNWDLYRFFFCKRGLRFALMTIPWHWLYFGYSGLAFVIGVVMYQIKKMSG